MSGDKRSVATDALEVLGNLITHKEVGRDAVHLACEPVVAGEVLLPGMHIGRLPDGTYGNAAKPHLGIVDPFLPQDKEIKPGAKFLLIVYPRTITSLRHVWVHPAFPSDDKVVNSGELIPGTPEWGYAKIEEFIETCVAPPNEGWKPFSADDLVYAMTNGKSLSSGAAEMWGEYDREELARYVEAITGSYVDADDFYFTCAC